MNATTVELDIILAKELLAKKNAIGLNALVGGIYQSNIENAVRDINAYRHSGLPAIAWFGDVHQDLLDNFFELVQDELLGYLGSWYLSGTHKQLPADFEELSDVQVNLISVYGLNPKVIPSGNTKAYEQLQVLQQARRKVLTNLIGVWINAMFQEYID